MAVLAPIFVDSQGLSQLRFADGIERPSRVALGSEPNPIDPTVPWLSEAIQAAAIESLPPGDPRLQNALRAPILALDGETRYIPLAEPFAPLLTRPDARHVAMYGGRASAKSWSMARAALILGATRPMRIGCYRLVQESIAASLKALLDDQIAELGLADVYESTKFEIRGRNGTRFLFGGLLSDPEKVKSTEGLDLAILEECEQITADAMRVLRPTVRKPGSQIWYAWNRRHATDHVDDMFLGGEPPPKSVVVQVSWKDNPWFSETLRGEMSWDYERDPDAAANTWGGELLIRSAARVFRSFRVEDLDAEADEVNAAELIGLDFGFANDPTVAIRAFILPPIAKGRPQQLYIAREARRTGLTASDTPALLAGSDKRLHATTGEPRWANPSGFEGIMLDQRSLIMADSATPAAIEELKRAGLRVEPAKKGAGSVATGVERLRKYEIVVHPSCEGVQEELRQYSYKVDRHTGHVLPDFAEGHDHAIDAARYILDGVHRKRFPSKRLAKIDDGAQPELPPGAFGGVVEGPLIAGIHFHRPY